MRNANVPLSGYRRISTALTAVALIFTLLSFDVLAGGSGNQSQTDPQQVILIWKIGSPHLGDTPAADIPQKLQAEAKKIGLSLNIETLPAQGFAERFFQARLSNEEPDILAIDNYGLLLGIRTTIGPFQGIFADPKVRESLVNVSVSMESLEPSGGWEFLISTSRNYGKAKALALRKLKCDSDAAIALPGISSDLNSDIRSVSERVVGAFLRVDAGELDTLSGGKYPEGALNLEDKKRSSTHEILTCGIWGNQRLAIVNTLASYERREELGHKDLTVILRNVNSRWELVHLFERVDAIGKLQRRLPSLKETEVTENLEAPSLISPSDTAAFFRFPAEQRPMLEWSRAGAGEIVYLVEAQIRWGGHWWQNRFQLVDDSAGAGATVKAKALFAVGMQPHRWRVWAINVSGDIVVSDWRTVNYLN